MSKQVEGAMVKPNREDLPDEYGAMVRRIARKLTTVSSLETDIEDLYQNGMIGLLGAWERYDPSHGVPFGAFAYYRVRGAMIDELRNLTGLTRTHVRKLVKLQAAHETAASYSDPEVTANPSPPSSETIFTGVVYSMEIAERAGAEAELEDDSEHLMDPERLTRRHERRETLTQAMEMLDEEDRHYIVEHYFNEKPLAEIARGRGVSRSWACRIHARAVERLGQVLGSMSHESDATF